MSYTSKIKSVVALLVLACATTAWGKEHGSPDGRHSHGSHNGGFHQVPHQISGGHFSNSPIEKRRRNDIYFYTHRGQANQFRESTQTHSARNVPSDRYRHNQNDSSADTHHGSVARTFPNRVGPNRESQYRDQAERSQFHGARSFRTHDGVVYEKPFFRNHRPFVQRTYIQNNYSSVRNYEVTYWGHRRLYSYVPYYVYPQPFFGWFWRPWGPVAYTWWWYDDPWFGYYGYYWSPYPVYYAPSLWVTDFVIADILAHAYAEEHAEAAARAEAQAQAVIDDKIKAQVREEVEAELKAREKQESVSLDQTLRPGYVHVMTKALDVAVAGTNGSCSLTAGDIIKVVQKPTQQDEVVEMSVVTSKKGDCGPNKRILVSLDDLQDMKNHFSESIDEGMEKLQEQQGKGGLPAASPKAQIQPKETVSPEETDQAVQETEDAAKEMNP